MSTTQVISRCPVCHSDVRPGMIHCRECQALLVPDVGHRPAPADSGGADSGGSAEQTLRVMCEHCGAEMRRGMVCCRECGHRVGASSTSESVRQSGDAQSGDAQFMEELLKQASLETVIPDEAVPPSSISSNQESRATVSSDRKPCFACGTPVEPDWVCCPLCQVSLLPVKPKRRTRQKVAGSELSPADSQTINLSEKSQSLPTRQNDVLLQTQCSADTNEIHQQPQSESCRANVEEVSSTPVAPISRKAPAVKSRSNPLNFSFPFGRRFLIAIVAVGVVLGGVGLKKSTVFHKVHRTVLKSSPVTALDNGATNARR